ncbi:Beta-2 adrenergic receptor [Trichinella spiralis]|uniref:Beta-2 adrenergic receptor n=1 Tax=Trichinella spiralis TaxID=6334 RepID=A0ABR3KM94_TRISP
MENSTNTILQEFPISESDITALAFYITLGCLAILLNSLMLVVIRRCRIKQVYSVFMSVLGCGNILLALAIINFEAQSYVTSVADGFPKNWTIRDCIIRAPHVSLFLVGYDITIILNQRNCCIVCSFIGIATTLKLALYWKNAFRYANVSVSHLCQLRECFGLSYQRAMVGMNFWMSSFTAVLYLMTLISVYFQRRTIHGQLRHMQLKRECTIMRSIAMILLTNIFSQILPWSLLYFRLDKRYPAVLRVSVTILDLNWCLTPTMYMTIHPEMQKTVGKLLPTNCCLPGCGRIFRNNTKVSVVYDG